MSNIELARFLMAAMWQLACMVIWYQRGNTERAKRCETEFMKLSEQAEKLEVDA